MKLISIAVAFTAALVATPAIAQQPAVVVGCVNGYAVDAYGRAISRDYIDGDTGLRETCPPANLPAMYPRYPNDKPSVEYNIRVENNYRYSGSYGYSSEWNRYFRDLNSRDYYRRNYDRRDYGRGYDYHRDSDNGGYVGDGRRNSSGRSYTGRQYDYNDSDRPVRDNRPYNSGIPSNRSYDYHRDSDNGGYAGSGSRRPRETRQGRDYNYNDGRSSRETRTYERRRERNVGNDVRYTERRAVRENRPSSNRRERSRPRRNRN